MFTLRENRQHEQCFFDRATLDALAVWLERFKQPCLLCAPMLGFELHRRRRSVRVLDLDERFADLPGFRRWNLRRPEFTGEKYDLVLCDPPFFGVSLHQLHQALRVLCGYDPNRPVAVSYLVRRERAFLSAMASFGLRGTGVRLGYEHVANVERNEVGLYANIAVKLPARGENQAQNGAA
ncbi:MAG: hypothetical protein KIS92_20150 [Planctomycetota bacterium]|nr:hypothetical protein [Planctomycetota bacterium]